MQTYWCEHLSESAGAAVASGKNKLLEWGNRMGCMIGVSISIVNIHHSIACSNSGC